MKVLKVIVDEKPKICDDCPIIQFVSATECGKMNDEFEYIPDNRCYCELEHDPEQVIAETKMHRFENEENN